MKTITLLASLTLGFTATTSLAQFAASTGFDYTAGKYGQSEETTISTWHVSGEYTYRTWSTQVYIPYEQITSPLGTIVINGRPRLQNRINAKNQGKTETESGLGDAELSLSYNTSKAFSKNWSVVFTGAVKLPTADEEKGLGTGTTDYGCALDLSRSFDRLSLSTSFCYRIVGKPTGSDLCNYAYGNAGFGYWITDTTNLHLAFECYQRYSTTTNVDNELSFGVNQHLADHWDLEVHALAGLSQSAPDYGAGASLRLSF
jgi:hypothetical protein